MHDDDLHRSSALQTVVDSRYPFPTFKKKLIFLGGLSSDPKGGFRLRVTVTFIDIFT